MSDPYETWTAAFVEYNRGTSARVRAAFAADSQSTSAQLRDTQKALAASQQDLTAMQAERDALAVLNAELKAEAREWRATTEQYLSQRDDALHDLAHAKFALSMAKTRVDHWKERAESALRRLSEMEGQ